jgi:oligoribonuclease
MLPLDVSTIKELCKRWSTQVFNNVPMKKLNHRAKDDILESIDELKYYRANLSKLEA